MANVKGILDDKSTSAYVNEKSLTDQVLLHLWEELGCCEFVDVVYIVL